MDIFVENLTKSFEHRKAVDSISFTAKKGEILGFLGPNGAGKTTTMKMLAGFLCPDSGNISIGDYTFKKHASKIKKTMGYLAEQNPLYEEMNVIDFLFFIAKLQNMPRYKTTARVLDMLRLCGLEKEKHKLIRELSKGFRQRLGMAQALIHDPEILILDEPTTGLDPNQIVKIHDIIKNVRQEKTIILSSHIFTEIETTCDQVMIMSQGKIVASGTISELRKKSESEFCLRVSLQGGKSMEIHEALSSIPGIKEVNLLHQQYFELQYLPEAEIEKAIFKLCCDRNWYISELTPVQTRLEYIFRKITQNQPL